MATTGTRKPPKMNYPKGPGKSGYMPPGSRWVNGKLVVPFQRGPNIAKIGGYTTDVGEMSPDEAKANDVRATRKRPKK